MLVPMCWRRGLTQPAEWTQIDVEIFVLQAERGLQLGHLAIQVEEREAKFLDLLRRQRPSVHALYRLMLQDLTKHFNQRQDKPPKFLTCAGGLSVYPVRKSPR